MTNPFPPLLLENWQETRDTLQQYAQIVAKVRRALTPKQKHWWHISLQTCAVGLTTTPIAYGQFVFEIVLNFLDHELVITTSNGDVLSMPMTGQSATDFIDEMQELLQELKIDVAMTPDHFAEEEGVYDDQAIESFWRAFVRIDATFKRLKATFRQESGPVVLWPHHFDLAVLWFSGNLVEGQDPTKADYADEQMNFGFVTGDNGIADPYFYVTAYPLPDGLADTSLPDGAYWHTEGWTGAILPYTLLTTTDTPEDMLFDFLTHVHKLGSALMLGD